ncbi:oil body-associated protein 1A isoform X2 [Coffea arabica]|uniref:Oil body-associated protein 1A isoform X2 n=1 Tax=Coffea arabica TaxID=13443 RepID=A0A6P6WS14_COFAR|nr:oil body-associated protein 1A-like isoform X2 [Coffea arabica]
MEGENVSTQPEVPGEPTQASTALLETATATLQGFGPVNKIHQHLCAFHFYAHDMTRQVEAHHFCGHQNEDFRQCLIYDKPDDDGKLIGLEYIISEELFLTLPDNEKPFWHTHEFEVKGGYLFMPGVPGPIQRQDLEKVMMALTRDGQLYPNLAQDVESRFGISFAKERENRAYMTGPAHALHPLGNAAGRGLQTVLREVDCKPVESVPSVFV